MGGHNRTPACQIRDVVCTISDLSMSVVSMFDIYPSSDLLKQVERARRMRSSCWGLSDRSVGVQRAIQQLNTAQICRKCPVPVECSKTPWDARLSPASRCCGFPGARAGTIVDSAEAQTLGKSFERPIPVLHPVLAEAEGLSNNVHMQLADPGNGKGIRIGFGSYQSGDTRTSFKDEKKTWRSGDPINLLDRLLDPAMKCA